MKKAINDSDPADEKSSVGVGIWIILGIILLVFGVYSACIAPRIEGNKFDPLNALFSGLAFWGVIYAILLQKSELELQRRELKLTRGEVRGQKEQLESQNLTLKQQRFENTFFSLLELCGNIVNSMEIPMPTIDPPPTIIKGRMCFRSLYRDFMQEYALTRSKSPGKSLLEICDGAYGKFTEHRHADVGHYFRTLRNIIEFVAASDIEPKEFYLNIVKDQLSGSELDLLFYDALSIFGNQKFKPLIEQFSLLKNMDLGHLCDQNHRDLYEESAFKSPL